VEALVDGSPAPRITALLERWSDGDERALDQLLPWVVRDLRKMAARQLGAERAGHTLQPTALVNETYLRLVGQRRVVWKNRAQFFALAATLMRRILIDHARARAARKRAGRPVTLESGVDIGVPPKRGVDALALDAALRRLEQMAPRQAKIVEMRFFSGLSVEEVAAALGFSPATVKADWALARAWLYRELESRPDSDSRARGVPDN
jgi:RNA polymerase sigma factor (TIGR02999 family)